MTSSLQPAETSKMKNWKQLFYLSIVLCVFAIGYFFTRNGERIGDEPFHYSQILDILQGSDLFPRQCPYLPGYHWSLAILCKLGHSCSGSFMRLLSSSLSFLCVLSFFGLSKKIEKDSSVQKLFSFSLFPAFFPFFFLVYTDIYSMFYVFLAFFFALDKRLWLSGFFGILSLLVRQNNIVWLVFIMAVVYFEEYYPQYRWSDVKKWIFKYLFFFLALALFGVFVLWNKGFVLGDKGNHWVSFSFGNSLLFLFFFFFLFLPQNLSNAKKIGQLLLRKKWVWPLLTALVIIHMHYFQQRHLYNTEVAIWHNVPLVFAKRSVLLRLAFFLPVAYALLSLCVTPFKKRFFYLLYPFALLSLLPLPVIEIRYIFLPFAFFILFKPKDSPRVAVATFLIDVAIILPAMYSMIKYHTIL